jgi:hypothetical protein
MAIRLTQADQKQLDELVEGILHAVQANELSVTHAKDALVRTVTAAALDNETEFYDWLDPEYLRRWKRELFAKGS